MKVTLLLFSTLLFNFAFAQEVRVLVVKPEALANRIYFEYQIQEANSIILADGQWTEVDRWRRLPRFYQAMEYIAIHNRTDLLANLEQISDYYRFLGQHPLVIGANVQWQNEAAKLTRNLQLLPLSVGLNFQFMKFIILPLNKKNPDYQNYQQIMNLGISDAGLDFIQGVASKKVLEDVTRYDYGPLLRGEKVVTDPFIFDADLLYREQYQILQVHFYQYFNAFDEVVVLGILSEVYAALGLAINLEIEDIDLMEPADRFFIGMTLMGYDDQGIENYLKTK